jgi:hypothetical protein
MTVEEAIREIERRRPALTIQEVRTLRGQAKAGDTDAAMRGLAKILNRRRNRHGL